MDIIVFACVHNAGRSQMAAAFFNALADPSKARAESAGTQPGDRVHPEVLAVMQEVGIDLSGVKPRKLTQELAESAEMLITWDARRRVPWCRDCCRWIGRYRIRKGSRSREYGRFGRRFDGRC